jgi:plasmid stability protein
VKNISIREAVKQFQVSRPTLTKALNSDKVSGQKDDNGTWMMDPSEVAWVYKPRLPSPDKEQADDALLEALKSQIEDLKARLDKSEDARAATATQFTAFLTDQRKRLNAEIEEDLYRKIKIKSAEEGRSISDITRDSWTDYLSADRFQALAKAKGYRHGAFLDILMDAYEGRTVELS